MTLIPNLQFSLVNNELKEASSITHNVNIVKNIKRLDHTKSFLALYKPCIMVRLKIASIVGKELSVMGFMDEFSKIPGGDKPAELLDSPDNIIPGQELVVPHLEES